MSAELATDIGTTEELEGYRTGFQQGFKAARALFGVHPGLDDPESVKRLAAGSLVKDARGRVLFRTTANGWVSVSSTRFSSMYLALPVEVLYYG